MLPRARHCQSPTPQRGAYSVVIVAVLALLTLLASKVMTVATMDSVRLTNNTHSATESFYAAEAALAEGVVWLESNNPTYSGGSTVSSQVTGTTVSYTLSKAGVDTSRSYATVFWFEDGGDRIRVFARASSGDNQSVVSTWVDDNSPLKAPALDTPLMLAQCLTSTTGSPEVQADPGGGGSYTTVRTKSGCSTTAIGTGCTGSPSSRRYGNLNCNGSAMSETIVDQQDLPGTDLWSTVFDTTRASLEALHSDDGSTGVYWVDASNVNTLKSGSKTWGSAANPVIIVIDECNSTGKVFLGNNTVWGLVFVESDSTGSGTGICDLNGLGGVTINGSYIVNGEGQQLNANTEITSAAIAGFDVDDFAGDVVLVAGTWTDQETD